MARNVAGPEIERLIQLLAKLPGLGPRSARRAALHLIEKNESLLAPLTAAMEVALEKVGVCSVCGNIDTSDPCTICRDDHRDGAVLVVVEGVADLWALERAGAISAKYHVLGGVLSPLDGVGPSDLTIDALIERCRHEPIREVILAVNATVEGQTTAHYVTDQLARLADEGREVTVTRLAHGVPVGGELDYLDDGTIAQAMRARTKF
ncbi:MAG: recombination protein RecR [Phyllobacteriaceae bacterium]|nr:recombination protein RecR [Phyllobacteriaceae bacterium]